MRLGLEHSYAALPARFFEEVAPAAAKAPALLLYNHALATFLGLDRSLIAAATQILSGNALPEDSRPIAMAYAGHQFGHFVPQLGDGRAILLGERRATDGRVFDIQLKGAGRTPWSRSGDGRAAIGPMLREYLISEAMHALGIATTRSLAVVATGEQVYREQVLPGAVLTRVAASHLRVGSFEYFAAREDTEALRTLLGYAIARHDPDLAGAENPALAFLQRVADRQAQLIAQWLSVGFIHGVMNTDNMALSGESIDYGPCAFMDHYHPQTVYSSIDHRGRYAYGNQTASAQWNLARFAETLLPLIDATLPMAVERVTAIVQGFSSDCEALLRQRLSTKIGFTTVEAGDSALINALLELMQQAQADFTLAFRYLADAACGPQHEAALRALFLDQPALDQWLKRWRQRLQHESLPAANVRASMRRANPAFIARNHRVEAALSAASDHGDLAPFNLLLKVLQHPFDDQPERADFMQPPRDDERVHATFCGT